MVSFIINGKIVFSSGSINSNNHLFDILQQAFIDT